MAQHSSIAVRWQTRIPLEIMGLSTWTCGSNVAESTMSTETLLRWFDSTARPFLAAHAPDRLPMLEEERGRIQNLLSRRRDMTVCVLGGSGIGKSTLLNALVADGRTVLPAGGIGPLTAQATAVTYSDVPSFKVRYHQKLSLWRLAFSLESRLEYERTQAAASTASVVGRGAPDFSDDLAKELSEEDREDAIHRVLVGNEGENPSPSTSGTLDGLVKQARLIVTGDQFSARGLPYLVDALRSACEVQMKWGSEISAEDMRRIVRLRSVLALARENVEHSRHQSGEGDAFMSDLKDHAAGFLAPMIERIQVGWPSELLRSGIELVDLPGIGVANDAYREVTREYIRDKAHVVIVVVDRAGPTESVIDLLKSTGYWDRLVGATDDPEADSCVLLLAVTRVDDVAWTTWGQARAEGRKPSKREVFAQTVAEFRLRMKAQAAEQFEQIAISSNETVQMAREAARKRILDSLEVHPVSAPEFAKIMANDDDDLPALKSVEETGVPDLQGSLTALGRREHARQAAHLRIVGERLLTATSSELRIVRASLKSVEHSAEAEQKFRQELEVFAKPKREEYDRRVGAFREFMDSTLAARIDGLVAEAREAAESEIKTLLKGLETAHWVTLQAAVRRGGTHFGTRRVNFPDDIAGRFQEPMAAVWSLKLLKDVRSRTEAFTSDIDQIVDEICKWSFTHDPGSMDRDLLSSQRQRVISLAAQLNDVGKDAANNLRDVVKTRLGDAIRPAIFEACRQFVLKGQHQGTGVKKRILELFNDLARSTMKAAEEPARRILHECCQPIREEIREAFKRMGHPIDSTIATITGASCPASFALHQAESRALISAIDDVLRTCPVAVMPAIDEGCEMVSPGAVCSDDLAAVVEA